MMKASIFPIWMPRAWKQCAAGEMINDSKQSFWEHMTPWIMNVTDDQNRLLFTLQFAAKVPSGQALYIPREGEAKNPLAEASG